MDEYTRVEEELRTTHAQYVTKIQNLLYLEQEMDTVYERERERYASVEKQLARMHQRMVGQRMASSIDGQSFDDSLGSASEELSGDGGVSESGDTLGSAASTESSDMGARVNSRNRRSRDIASRTRQNSSDSDSAPRRQPSRSTRSRRRRARRSRQSPSDSSELSESSNGE